MDERAVLKHFDWPEQKADALREAAFGYCDLRKLESEASSFRDDPRQMCGPALKKMQALLEKYGTLGLLHLESSNFEPQCLNFLLMIVVSDSNRLEHGVYNLSRMRESAAKRYKGFQIPMDWMLENGIVSQVIKSFPHRLLPCSF